MVTVYLLKVNFWRTFCGNMAPYLAPNGIDANSMQVSKLTTIMCLILVISACDVVDVPAGRMPPVLALGEQAPDFEFHALDSANDDSDKITRRLSAFHGRVIYLDFWASWCLPCKKSMPLLNQMRTELDGTRFEIIAVNLDEQPENGIAFLQEHPVGYPVVQAIDDNISELYQLNGLPTSYLIDRDGVLQYAHQGFKEQDMSIIRKQVKALLDQNTKENPPS